MTTLMAGKVAERPVGSVQPVGLVDRIAERAAAQHLRLGPSQTQALQVLAELERGGAGVYLHGPAGRGKTWLLDAVTACSDVPVTRVHASALFTRLDAEVGRRLHAPDRLVAGLDAVLGDGRLLCFDELEVTDPDDAGMVEHLLLRMGARGVPVLLTSNQAPADLLTDPRWQHWGRGLRRIVEERFVVRHLDDGVDYRTLGATTPFASGRVLASSAVPVGGEPAGLISGGRPLPVVRHGEQLWAEFRALLDRPTGRQDYLLLARHAPAFGLSGVPNLGAVDADPRQRFVVLVDVLHDAGTRLLLALDEGVGATEPWPCLPPRTISRLSLLDWSAGGS